MLTTDAILSQDFAIRAMERAITNPVLYALAKIAARELMRDSHDSDHDRKPGALRGSDSGRCARELWADIHGKLDIPEDPQALLRMIDGTHSGAIRAALIKVGLEDEFPSLQVTCEAVIDEDDFTGHVDVLIERVVTDGPDREDWALEPVAVIELKSTAVMGAPRPPEQPNTRKNTRGFFETREFHIFQAVKYAQRTGCPDAFVMTSSPGGTRLDRYPVQEWAEKVDAEYARLAVALEDALPDGDPPQDFRCSSCRFSHCESNKNSNREVMA